MCSSDLVLFCDSKSVINRGGRDGTTWAGEFERGRDRGREGGRAHGEKQVGVIGEGNHSLWSELDLGGKRQHCCLCSHSDVTILHTCTHKRSCSLQIQVHSNMCCGVLGSF